MRNKYVYSITKIVNKYCFYYWIGAMYSKVIEKYYLHGGTTPSNGGSLAGTHGGYNGAGNGPGGGIKNNLGKPTGDCKTMSGFWMK